MTICSSFRRNGATSLLERERLMIFLVEAMDGDYALFLFCRHLTIICDSLAEWLGRSTRAQETTLSRVFNAARASSFSLKIEEVSCKCSTLFSHISWASRIVSSHDRVFKGFQCIELL